MKITKRTITASEYLYDNQPYDCYWYFTRHGVGIGSIPKGAQVYYTLEADGGEYFLTDKLLTTKALNDYEIKEQAPKGMTKELTEKLFNNLYVIIWDNDVVTFYETYRDMDNDYKEQSENGLSGQVMKTSEFLDKWAEKNM